MQGLRFNPHHHKKKGKKWKAMWLRLWKAKTKQANTIKSRGSEFLVSSVFRLPNPVDFKLTWEPSALPFGVHVNVVLSPGSSRDIWGVSWRFMVRAVPSLWLAFSSLLPITFANIQLLTWKTFSHLNDIGNSQEIHVIFRLRVSHNTIFKWGVCF
jgi:hypothetical protein